jgi:hypothetical protein
MNDINKIVETIKHLNPVIAEVLEEKLAEKDLVNFSKIVSNFIKINYQK